MNLNAGGKRSPVESKAPQKQTRGLVWDGDVDKWGAYRSQQVPNSTVRYGTGQNVDYAKKAGKDYNTPVLVSKYNEKQRDFIQSKPLEGISRSRN